MYRLESLHGEMTLNKSELVNYLSMSNVTDDDIDSVFNLNLPRVTVVNFDDIAYTITKL